MAPLPPNSDYETHRDMVEAARVKRYRQKPKPSTRILKLRGYTNSELHAELGRRAQRALTEKLGPEGRSELSRKAAATKRVRAEFCDHTKHPPKFRASGKNKGSWVCPTCNKVVQAPKKEEEGLVT